MYLLLLGVLLGVLNIALILKLNKGIKNLYIDEDGNKRKVSPDFTMEDLEEVYKELDKMPLE